MLTWIGITSNNWSGWSLHKLAYEKIKSVARAFYHPLFPSMTNSHYIFYLPFETEASAGSTDVGDCVGSAGTGAVVIAGSIVDMHSNGWELSQNNSTPHCWTLLSIVWVLPFL